MGSTDVTQHWLQHTARWDNPQARHSARVSGRSTLQDAWAERTAWEGLTMPGSACFLQNDGLLPGKLNVGFNLQPSFWHLLLYVLTCTQVCVRQQVQHLCSPKFVFARLLRGGTMSACLWSLQYSGDPPSKL